MIHGDVFRDGHVYVCNQKCSTCIFRRGNPMRLERGRVKAMVEAAIAEDTAIICHQSHLGDHDAVCRGFYDRYETTPLKLAKSLQTVEMVVPAQDQEDALAAHRRAIDEHRLGVPSLAAHRRRKGLKT